MKLARRNVKRSFACLSGVFDSLFVIEVGLAGVACFVEAATPFGVVGLEARWVMGLVPFHAWGVFLYCRED